MMKKILTAAAAIAVAAGSANAAFFSFASDRASGAWTFTGSGASITAATGPMNFLDLHIDDQNGPMPTITNSVIFRADFTISYVGSIPLGAGAFSHNYLSQGTFTFLDVATGTALLTTVFEGGLFTARGGASSWFSTAALQADNGPGGFVGMTWGGRDLPAYGLGTGPLAGLPSGFAFDFTALNTSGSIPYDNSSPGVEVDTATRLPVQQWWSESSYSAHGFVPTPGTLALVGMGGLVLARRRR